MSTVQTTNIKHAASASNNITLDASGNVGMGVAAPTQKLELGAATACRMMVSETGSTVQAQVASNTVETIFGAFSNHPVVFRTNNAERMRITAAGLVGIGTSSPGTTLHLYNATNPVLRLAAGADAGLFVDYISGFGANVNVASNFPLILGTNNTERMRIDSAGNVGIGTASPTERLHVNGNLRTQGSFVLANSTGDKIYPYFASATNHNYIGAESDGSISFGAGTSSPAERARITPSGDFRFNSGYGSVATAYGCRAWVNFNGTGTVAIRASGNVSSITDFNTGDYGINLATAMPDANYAVVGSYQFDGTLPAAVNTFDQSMQIYPQLTNQIYVYTGFVNSGSSNRVDVLKCCIAVFR